jgi:hypothetical protein
LTSIGLGVDITWITNLCFDISNSITSLGSNDWQVVPYSWVSQAGFGNISADALNSISSATLAEFAEPALDNAENIGTQIGRQIAGQGWQRVHLIGHSAGSGLIQAAADAIRANSPTTIIQTTFLDPYLGADFRGLSWYGSNADWSENYFTYDMETGIYTQGSLSNAFNVDVTWVDPNKTSVPVLCSSSTADSTVPLLNNYCGTNAFSTHSWPIDFYTETVLGTETNCAAGYGFPLSFESGGWNNIANDHEGYAPIPLCGSSPVAQNQFPLATGSQIQIGILPNAISSSGAGWSGNSGFVLSSVSQTASPNGVRAMLVTPTTNTPAWLAVGLTITNAVNYVQFDSAFTDTNSAQGLLTVYWDTNQIGTVDERVVSPGIQTYRFFLPNTATNNVYVLGFRLDAFNNTSPSIMVTNVETGFVGITTPLTLGISLTNATPLLQLTGAANYNYIMQTSTNLVDWTPTALLVNSNGTVLFQDSTATNSATQFYRAVMP